MKKLFETINFGGLSLKNRFIRSATWEELADEKGHLTPELIEVYRQLSEGGVGTITLGYANILEDDQPSHKMSGIYNDSFIDEYRDLTDMVHENGAKIVIQIVHGGSNTAYNLENRKIVAPSAVQNIAFGTMPEEITKEEISSVVKAFADAAVRAKASGFDAVEIHAAHGFLLNQFLTPYYNRRTDEYGGPIENRARIIFETYDAIRNAVGKDYPIWIKIGCDDFMDGGLTGEESFYVCKILAEKGISAIEVSGGSYSSRAGEGPARGHLFRKENESYFKNWADKIAKETGVSVTLVGGNRTLEGMEEVLNNTAIQCFSLSRPLLREPDLINQFQIVEGKKPKCISCNQCFMVEGHRYCIFNKKN